MADRPSPIELQKHLGGIDYPATKEDILRHAQDQGAPDEVLAPLRDIPDREYDGPNAVSSAFSDQA
jgi:Protein of unknown function (DUF2795)